MVILKFGSALARNLFIMVHKVNKRLQSKVKFSKLPALGQSTFN